MLPPVLLEPVSAALRAAGEALPIRSFESLKGGYSSTSLKILTRRAAFLLKWNDSSRPSRYTAEARGLELIGQSGALRVPGVIAAADATADVPGYMLQEWIATRPGGWTKHMGQQVGAGVAALHRAGGPGYGVVRAESGGWHQNWAACYREQFLRPLVERAARAGQIAPELRGGIERLMGRLDSLLDGAERQPALIHGDLWRNNVLCDRAGAPVLIDPVAAYADRELELAYAELYGGFGLSFFDAYEEIWPRAPGRAERRDLYRLYFLLQRLGTRFSPTAAEIDAIVRWYAG